MKKFLSILLSVAMLITILPATLGFAEDAAKYSLTWRDKDKDGDVELGEELTYTWKFNSGYEYVNYYSFEIDYDSRYLTPTSVTGKVISLTTQSWEIQGDKIIGFGMSTGNAWTKEEEEDDDTGDITVNNLNLLVVKFMVKEDVPANTESDVVLNVTKYQILDDALKAVDVPVEIAQKGKFIINPQEVVEQSSDATLKTLKYGDTAIELEADKYTYDVELPYGVAAPAITYEVNDAKASAVLEGNKVVVTAEDGTELTYTINFTNAAPAVIGIKADKAAIEVPYANRDAVADYVKAHVAVNYVTEAGEGEAIEVFEVAAADGTATITVGEYTTTVAYTVAEPLVTGIEADKESIEVPYANRDAVADYVKANVAVNYVTEAGKGEAVEVFEVAAADGSATITVGEYTTTVAYTVAEPLVTGIEADKESIEVPYANRDAVADYVKANVAVNYVTEAGKGEAIEVFEVAAADGIATITVGDYTATVEYTVAEPLVIDIKVDTESIEVPYEYKDAVADYVKANVAVNYVTEAGDGEAVEAFEVAAVDGIATITVGDYTATVEYTIAEKLYKLNVSAVNGTISATYADKVDEAWESGKVAEFTTGSQITLKAVADEGAEFVYWMDNKTNRVVSYSDVYPIVIGTDKDLTAIFAFVDEDVFTVEFIGFNNKVYLYGSSNADITVPANPYILGHTFEGWAINGVKSEYKAGDVIAAGTFAADTKIKAIQTVDATKYAVTLIGANEVGGEYEYNKPITVTPVVPEGKVFAYWKRDGKIASYNAEFSFFVANYATTVEAVFADEEVEAAATITMAQPTVVAGNKLSFIMERTVPEGYSVVEAGILVKAGAITEEGVITLDNFDGKGVSANKAPYGAYTARKANVNAGESWSAVGYLIYTDGANTYTIYTAPVVGTLN